jgi:DDE superfamily endonuclease.
MSERFDKAENRIQEALQAYHDRKKPKIKPLAQEFGVSYQRLLRRVHGRNSRSTRPGTNKALDNAQEQALIAWIGILDDAMAPPTPQDIESCANEILARGGSTRRVGKNWAYNLIKRLPNDYSHIIQKPMEAERIDAERLPTIIEWFYRLEVALKTYKVGPKNIYNFDESGFQLGQGKSQRVVTKHKCSTKSIPTGGIGETVTGVECIAADGWAMPPFILFQGSYHLENWYRQQPDLPDNYVIATSSTGWNNEVSAYKAYILVRKAFIVTRCAHINGSNISKSIPKTAFQSVGITDFSLWTITHHISASTSSTTAKITESFLGQYLQSLHISYNLWMGTRSRHTNIITAGTIIG